MIPSFDTREMRRKIRDLTRTNAGRAHLGKMIETQRNAKAALEELHRLGCDIPESVAELKTIEGNIELLRRSLGEVRA